MYSSDTKPRATSCNSSDFCSYICQVQSLSNQVLRWAFFNETVSDIWNGLLLTQVSNNTAPKCSLPRVGSFDSSSTGWQICIGTILGGHCEVMDYFRKKIFIKKNCLDIYLLKVIKQIWCEIHHDLATASGLFFMNSKLHGI